MASFIPRRPYSDEELSRLYPAELILVQVQILLRHGERAPISPRFQNAGLSPFWPYCSIARRFKAELMAKVDGSKWDESSFRRRIETFGAGDLPVAAESPDKGVSDICQLGELTDKGRSTTLALGQRLRELYVNRLGFLPPALSSSSFIYLRASPYPRALESVQQSFYGLYPTTTRHGSAAPPFIYTRNPVDETLYDNANNCRRMGLLAKAFGQRAAERWNNTEDLEYVNKMIGKWMPESSPRIKVDSHPRLSGIMDTINATDAHGPATKLPKEFYDAKLRQIADKVVTDEWFSGYVESEEYRRLGWGSLIGDLVSRMMGVVKHEASGPSNVWKPEEEGPIRFAMSGCHDTTIAGTLSSLGAFANEGWPPFTSHLAIELFRKKSEEDHLHAPNSRSSSAHDATLSSERKETWFGRLLPFIYSGSASKTVPMERKPLQDLSESDHKRIQQYYVRIRYNDRPVTIPGCQIAGRHLDSSGVKDKSFCTLEAFKAIVDAITPRDWKAECASGLDKPVRVPRSEDEKELAGYIPGDMPATHTSGPTA